MRAASTLDPKRSVRPEVIAPGLERLAWLMDRAIRIPGTNVRVGLDAILGLLPVGGDVLTGLVQAGLALYIIGRYNVPRAVAARMAANVLLDIGLGSIPVVGDLFDAVFKANTRNLQLLQQVQEHHRRGEPVPSGPSVRWLIGLGVALGAALVLVLVGFIALIVWVTRVTHP
jgi:hypothetical protein